MDILAAAENARLLQARIDARLNDERVDRSLVEKLYIMSGRHYKCLSLPALEQRYRELIRNMAYLFDDVRDLAPARCKFVSSWWWIDRYIEFHAEFMERALGPPPLPPETGEWGEPSPLIKPKHANAIDFIVRYGQMPHLREMLEIGKVRIATASIYNDGGLDKARRDNELKKSYYSDGAKVSITLPDGSIVKPIGAVEYAKTTTDYYTLCTSLEHDPRLRRDFPNKEGKPADACLIVRDLAAFAARLAGAVAHILPGWQFWDLPIEYYDELQRDQDQVVSAQFSKELRFAYQREYRFIWTKPLNDSLKPFFFVEIGALNDIATLVTAEGEFVAGHPLP